MTSELEKRIHDFFGQMDWPRFYQGKMALCEIMDRFTGSEVVEEKNAIEWMNDILEMMDEMGDIAESMGLFVYPQWDDDIRCLDDRYNNVLSKLPADVETKPEQTPSAGMTEKDCFLVTLRRTSTTDVMNPEIYEDDFVMLIPQNMKAEERTEYIKNTFLEMVHDVLTGPNAVAYIRESSRAFNWGDFVNDVSREIQEKYSCFDVFYPANKKWLCNCKERLIIDVNQNEILLWEEEPCTIYLDGKAVCEALANMVTGKVTCHQNIDMDAAQLTAIEFAEGGKAMFPLAKTLSETSTGEKKDVYYWLGQK